QETPLAETGLTLSRINVYHAVQAVKQLMEQTPGDPGGNPGDPNDPGGTVGGSAPLPDPGSGLGSVSGIIGSPNDVDLYQIDVTSPDSLNISVGPVSGGPDFDSYLRLFDHNGHEIGSNDDISPSDQWSQIISGILQAGLYYIGVTSDGNT